VMNMLLGDIVEAAFKGIITEAGVAYEDEDNFVQLELNEDTIHGSYDLIMDGALDDVKSASDWSYRNKFESYDTLSKGDSFGYIGQLAGYAKATGKKVGGWWVVNKANGQFKYVDASEGVDKEAVLSDIQALVDYIDNDEPFERCYEPVEETFYRKKTGNWVLPSGCKFCSFKHKCHTNLQPRPSIPSKSKNPQIVDYTYIAPEYLNEQEA